MENMVEMITIPTFQRNYRWTDEQIDFQKFQEIIQKIESSPKR